MPEKLEIYKCDVCGNIIEMLHGGKGKLICCGQPMKLQEENTVDASLEKHVPVVEKSDAGVKVKVGAAPHPMEEKHYIEWVQISVGETSVIRFLKPGEAPEAQFCECLNMEGANVRAYCNLHGLWKA